MYLFSSSISCLWCCFVLGQSSGLLPQLSYCSIASQLSSIVALGKVLSVDHERWSVCSTLVGPHLAHWCELPSKERNWHMGESSTQGSWDDGLEHLSCEKGWGLWLFNLEESQRDLINALCFVVFFYTKGGEALAQVAQRGGGCPIPGDTQGQAGQGSEQPDWAVGVSVHCRRVQLGDP